MLHLLPHQLVNFLASNFSNVLMTQHARLLATGWGATDIDVVEQEYIDFVNAHHLKPAHCYAIASISNGTYFAAYWYIVKIQFQALNFFRGACKRLPRNKSSRRLIFCCKSRKGNLPHSYYQLLV